MEWRKGTLGKGGKKLKGKGMEEMRKETEREGNRGKELREKERRN